MRLGVAQRAFGLAGVALLAAVVALAFARSGDGDEDDRLPRPTMWTSALVAPYGPSASRPRTSCGQRLTKELAGIAHPVLPCGVKIFISYRGKEVLTQVVDRGPKVPGRTFDVTVALAEKIGLHGVQRVRWAYAR